MQIYSFVNDKSKLYFMNASYLKKLTEELGVSVNEFERAIGVGNSTISRAIQRDSVIKKDTIEKICNTYPQVS